MEHRIWHCLLLLIEFVCFSRVELIYSSANRLHRDHYSQASNRLDWKILSWWPCFETLFPEQRNKLPCLTKFEVVFIFAKENRIKQPFSEFSPVKFRWFKCLFVVNDFVGIKRIHLLCGIYFPLMMRFWYQWRPEHCGYPRGRWILGMASKSKRQSTSSNLSVILYASSSCISPKDGIQVSLPTLSCHSGGPISSKFTVVVFFLPGLVECCWVRGSCRPDLATRFTNSDCRLPQKTNCCYICNPQFVSQGKSSSMLAFVVKQEPVSLLEYSHDLAQTGKVIFTV